MKLEAASPEVVALFRAVLPDDERIEKGKALGFDAVFINGHMFGAVFESSLLVRLPHGERADALSLAGAQQFEPTPGKIVKDYVRLSGDALSDRRKLVAWFLRAFNHAAALPVARRKL